MGERARAGGFDGPAGGRHGWRAGTVAVLAAATLAACAVQQGVRHAHVREPGMSCAEATRVASGALFRLGYTPEVEAAAHPGSPGRIVGRKEAGWATANPEPGAVYVSVVTITCSNQGAEIAATTDEPLPASLTFANDFAEAVTAVAARRTVRPQLAERPATGLVITVEPLRPSEAGATFGTDLPAAEITAVRISIDNRTDRAYAFRAERVQLVSQEGDRRRPLPVADRPALDARRIADATIAPRTVHAGYLYFPAAAYRRATLVLVDQKSEEEEGFRVEF